jgi:hypothetical protein
MKLYALAALIFAQVALGGVGPSKPKNVEYDEIDEEYANYLDHGYSRIPDTTFSPMEIDAFLKNKDALRHIGVDKYRPKNQDRRRLLDAYMACHPDKNGSPFATGLSIKLGDMKKELDNSFRSSRESVTSVDVMLRLMDMFSGSQMLESRFGVKVFFPGDLTEMFDSLKARLKSARENYDQVSKLYEEVSGIYDVLNERQYVFDESASFLIPSKIVVDMKATIYNAAGVCLNIPDDTDVEEFFDQLADVYPKGLEILSKTDHYKLLISVYNSKAAVKLVHISLYKVCCARGKYSQQCKVRSAMKKFESQHLCSASDEEMVALLNEVVPEKSLFKPMVVYAETLLFASRLQFAIAFRKYKGETKYTAQSPLIEELTQKLITLLSSITSIPERSSYSGINIEGEPDSIVPYAKLFMQDTADIEKNLNEKSLKETIQASSDFFKNNLNRLHAEYFSLPAKDADRIFGIKMRNDAIYLKKMDSNFASDQAVKHIGYRMTIELRRRTNWFFRIWYGFTDSFGVMGDIVSMIKMINSVIALGIDIMWNGEFFTEKGQQEMLSRSHDIYMRSFKVLYNFVIHSAVDDFLKEATSEEDKRSRVKAAWIVAKSWRSI